VTDDIEIDIPPRPNRFCHNICRLANGIYLLRANLADQAREFLQITTGETTSRDRFHSQGVVKVFAPVKGVPLPRFLHHYTLPHGGHLPPPGAGCYQFGGESPQIDGIPHCTGGGEQMRIPRRVQDAVSARSEIVEKKSKSVVCTHMVRTPEADDQCSPFLQTSGKFSVFCPVLRGKAEQNHIIGFDFF